MHLHEALARTLRDHGVDRVFGLIGDANLFLMNSFQDVGGDFVAFANEAATVLAAFGHSQVTDSLGVATVTHGPGLTNCVTALVEVARAGRPMLLVVGDTDTRDPENLQDVAQAAVVAPTGVEFVPVREPGRYLEDVGMAVRLAWSKRIPVVLNVPVDFMWEDVAYERRPVPDPRPPRPAPEAAALDAAAGLLASARRPLVLAGRGATDADARAALLALSARLGAPLATTLQAKDLFRGEQFDIGIFGTLSHDAAIDVITGADLVVSFGAGLNKFTTASGDLLRGRKLIQVDADPAALNRWYGADECVLADSALAARALTALLDEADLPRTGFASTEMAIMLRTAEDIDFADMSTASTIDLRVALKLIEQGVAPDRTLVIDAGRFIAHAYRNLHVPSPRHYLHTARFGAIGLGMGTAIGVATADPARPTLMVCGDGGFMLGGLTEFNTAVRERLNLLVIVLNDGAYGAEHIQFTDRSLDPGISEFDWPELAPVAVALGGGGAPARTAEELQHALQQAEHATGPFLIDVKLDPSRVPGNTKITSIRR